MIRTIVFSSPGPPAHLDEDRCPRIVRQRRHGDADNSGRSARADQIADTELIRDHLYTPENRR